MPDQFIHIYEKIPLLHAGICMGVALALGHLIALLRPQQVISLLRQACASNRAGQALMITNFLWILLLLWNSPGNPLRIELFDFEFARGMLILAGPIVCYTLCAYSGPNLFGRAVGLFLLLLGIVPLSAAFLKQPESRILIPLWWYPVLTYAILLIPMPWLLRDTAAWLAKRPTLTRALAAAGLVYALAILTCALLFWS